MVASWCISSRAAIWLRRPGKPLVQATKNSRRLRRLGVTVRKTIDAVIATRRIESGYDLLHNDRDFDRFAKHLGLRVAVGRPGCLGESRDAKPCALRAR